MILRRFAVSAISIAVLTALLGQPAAANAAKVQTKALEWRYDAVYKDSATGRSYFHAYSHLDNQYFSRVIFATDEGTWFSLPDKYGNIYRSSSPKETYLQEAGVYGDILSRKVYDTVYDEVTNETTYLPSPDGKWGMRQLDYYTLEPYEQGKGFYQRKQISVVIKDFSTGKVRETTLIPSRTWLRWMPDNKLLTTTYSKTERQNEIITIDPATGGSHRLLLASMYGYRPKQQLILFAYNEPTRKEWVYDLGSGKIRAMTKQDKDLFYYPDGDSQPADDLKPTIIPPADLDPGQLPVEQTTETTDNEAAAVINGTTVGLPYAFESGGKTWIPVRSLMDAFGMKVDKLSDGRLDYAFKVTNGKSSIIATSGNSRVYGFRLLLTRDELKKLGLNLESVSWLS
ncbi:hypothetical protein KZ483_02850 [Paenibacillus sp. sptzw28]|uniref:hypothetical protein n=1 Tax=Paenibacillus sp. sptzw28 TaxID=715179 RepID=UPI001C6E5433|nr:hypothetical protein [Paenibacillus sp. sptzw28]QYR21990.1 hypothetical protein KZ483_02850 [Paenibacillus sp. sptzw28]